MSSGPVLNYHWSWKLRSSPTALWPYVADTDRFNRDCGYPAVQLVATDARTGARQLRAKALGLTIEWTEQPFEWVESHRYAVRRDYSAGPLRRMEVSCELSPELGGGTRLDYRITAAPSGLAGRLGLPFWLGRRARAITEQVLRAYDEAAAVAAPPPARGQRVRLGSSRDAHLQSGFATLARTQPETAPLAPRLRDLLTSADEVTLQRVRPYALADQWRVARRDVLQLCLAATRVGLLDFTWERLCPHCRGSAGAVSELKQLEAKAHCPTCDVDFLANFDQSVELTFRPNAAVRVVPRAEYCVAGPRVTPHVIAQFALDPATERTVPLELAPGRYRVRGSGVAEQHAFRVEVFAPATLRIDLGAKPLTEPAVGPRVTLHVGNQQSAPTVVRVERLAWTDDSATAAEVTALQLFRDLFAHEVLRRGEQFSIGTLTLAFTDLKNSTQLYQELGDGPAFSRVLTHFDVLKNAIAANEGAIVKTMGDAVMAVFTHPVAAVRAIVTAQRWLAHPAEFATAHPSASAAETLTPLRLKAGIHRGPCLAINQNDRLDYFGTTVNIAARLCGLCAGADLVLSSAVNADPEVETYLDAQDRLTAERESVALKGFGAARFEVWRVRARD